MSAIQGPLLKWTNVMKGYQQRWFVLDELNGLLSYYTSQEKLVKGDRRGCIRLNGAVVGIDDVDDTIFTITSDNKIFHLKAPSTEIRDKWVTCLEKHILNHSQRKRPIYGFQKVPTIEEFNKKLTETDSYLQILINQLKKIDDKIANASSDIEKAKLNTLKDQSVYLLDSIKHTIVLLQISKNIKCPVNSVYFDGNSNVNHISINSQNSNSVKSDESTSEKGQSVSPTSIVTPNINQVINSYSNEIKSVQNEFFQTKVPDISYASSDDEDCFFDANDDYVNSGENSNSENNMNLKTNAGKETKKSNNEINIDKIYESDDEDEFDLQPHGSVFSHILSQVKIGMDLTKVALPTHILERRSLLEMYADFFAHADIFVSIPDYKTPQDRMVQLVKWYLSAFHAGRKGSVAKKPYNPVLGEVFRCYWNLTKNDTIKSECNDGPVPWAKSSDLTFIAEQVSHHPPISAFYAESIDKRIMCCAHIWTKSKFLGISIGVNNIGTGSIYLLDHGEEYTCTFPSAYGRSILLEPWFELGGSVDINCQQTGYSARIDFLTKPFYGGKKHKINAEIYGPLPTKKLIVTVNGEWNGQMEAKWAETGKAELFIDTKSIPIIKKQVMPVSEQKEYESRNLWKQVTVALKRHDVNEATNAKIAIEQHQRDLVKEREQKTLKWENRVFHSLGDKWFYNNPLTNRKPRNESSNRSTIPN